MNKKRLIDYTEVRELFNEEFKETWKLIESGETHLDNLAEGFIEADRVLFKLICLKPMTNADHIRSMSDEELADFLMLQVQMSKASNASEILSGFEEITKIAWLNWLKQPYKENTDAKKEN